MTPETGLNLCNESTRLALFHGLAPTGRNIGIGEGEMNAAYFTVVAAVALVLGLDLGWLTYASATHADLVTASFDAKENRATVHEPIFIDFAVSNNSSEPVQLDLGIDLKSNFEFEVTRGGGEYLRLPRLLRAGFRRSGKIFVEPGQKYRQVLLFSEWYQFGEPGSYTIHARITEPIRRRGGPPLSTHDSGEITLEISPRDEKRLRAVCERLVKAAVNWEYDDNATAAAHALSYVEDPVAIPYLAELLATRQEIASHAIAGLKRIRTPEAVKALKAHLGTSDLALRSQIEAALWEIETGRPVGVAD